jgi:hypothetical protein
LGEAQEDGVTLAETLIQADLPTVGMVQVVACVQEIVV